MHEPKFLSSDNLTHAWAEATRALLKRGVKALAPLTVVIDGISDGVPSEDVVLRAQIEQELVRHGKQSINTVANTIFPAVLWPDSVGDDDHLKANRNELYTKYDRLWRKIRQDRDNRRGTYFRRMTHYCPKESHTSINQLEHVVATYKDRANHRHSALQISIIDPTRDHVHSQRLGFPCLHQVAFTPLGDGKLSVTGFYATQYIFDRAYGNYIGLCRLGNFVANQWGLELKRIVCVAGKARLGDKISKRDVRPLVLRRL